MKYRMYFFVPYHLSGRQIGIQAGHCALEYARLYGDTKEYLEFIENDKTWIILNGGTTRDEPFDGEPGALNDIVHQLANNPIRYSVFREPDLNFTLTAVCFLADERVWDMEKYPEFDFINDELAFLAEESPKYQEWLHAIGGEQNAFLRELLENKRLA